MIKLMNLTMPLQFSQEQLYQAVAKRLKVPVGDILQIQYFKKSIDARKKPYITSVWSLLLRTKKETAILKKWANDHDIQEYHPYVYTIPVCEPISHRPVIVGFGPAGMFAALLLAKAGLQPLILERGACVEDRQHDIIQFQTTRQLNPESNIQFGEGGAGTFSDGKLTTGIKDLRIRFILETFVSCGAPEEILYLAKPHIGTDRLVQVVHAMREQIQAYGAEIQFHAHMKNFLKKDGRLIGITYEQNGKLHQIETNHCIFAVGHSARDMFTMLHAENIALQQKDFAMGVRVEHKQVMIDKAMYGRVSTPPDLPVGDYKAVVHLPDGRNLYTFCMCPGGEVVAASSEPNHLAINGMSCYARNGENANSALLVGIRAEELHDTHPLAGLNL